MKTLRYFTLATLLVFGASNVWAQDKNPKKKHFRENQKEWTKSRAESSKTDWQSELALTDAQKNEIKAIRSKRMEEKKELREKMNTLKKEEQKEIAEVFTPEQKEKMAEMRKNRKHRPMKTGRKGRR